MAVTPIGARCRRCGRDFHLFELPDQRSGTCPRRGRLLTEDWTAILLHDVARADIAQRHLLQALRRLRNLPGNLAVRPHTVLRNRFEETGWHNDLADDPDMLREELLELRHLAAARPDRRRSPASPQLARAIDAITGRPPDMDPASTPDVAARTERFVLLNLAASRASSATQPKTVATGS